MSYTTIGISHQKNNNWKDNNRNCNILNNEKKTNNKKNDSNWKTKRFFFLDSFQVWGEPNTVYVDAHRASFKVVMYS